MGFPYTMYFIFISVKVSFVQMVVCVTYGLRRKHIRTYAERKLRGLTLVFWALPILYLSAFLYWFRTYIVHEWPFWRVWEWLSDSCTSSIVKYLGWIKGMKTGLYSLLHVHLVECSHTSCANKNNYSRWMPVYILYMVELLGEILSSFDVDEFSVRQSSGFSKDTGIWINIASEKFIIKDSKGSGDIVGVSSQNLC